MKASYHNERKVGNPKHNDRSIKLENAPHIDADKTKYNKILCVYPGMSFEEAEKEFYRRNFSKLAEERNEKARRARHKEREVTTETLRKGRYTRPEETILQIGDMNEYPDSPKVLARIFGELQHYSNQITHHRAKILNAALHLDEATPHIHFRKVWIYEEGGIKKIGQEKALKQAGIELPNPAEPESQYNNRKMTYDRMMREKLYELCKEHGIEIDIVPDLHNVTHMTKYEFVQRLKEDKERAREERRRRKEERRKQGEKQEKR